MLAEEDIEGKVAVVLAGTQLVGDIQVAVEVDMVVQVGGSQVVVLLGQGGGRQAARKQVSEPPVDIRGETRMQAALLLLVESR